MSSIFEIEELEQQTIEGVVNDIQVFKDGNNLITRFKLTNQEDHIITIESDASWLQDKSLESPIKIGDWLIVTQNIQRVGDYKKKLS